MNIFLQINNLIFWFVLELSRPTLSFSLAERVESPTQLGMLLAFQSVLPLLLAIPIGLAGDRLGPQKLLPVGSLLLLVSGLFYLAADQMQVVDSGYLLLILAGQLASGVAWLLVWISTQSLVSMSVTKLEKGNETSKRVNLLALTSSIGALGGPVTSGFLYPIGGGRMIWIVFLITVGVHLCLSYQISRMANGKAERSKSPLAEGTPIPSGRRGRGLTDLGGPLYLFVILASLVLFFGSEFRASYMPAYLSQSGLDTQSIGIVLTIGAIGVGVARLLISLNVLRFDPRVTICLALGMSVAGVALLPVMQWGGVATLAPISLLLAVGVGIGEPVLIFTILQHAKPLRRSLALAGRLTANRAAMLLAPVCSGLAVSMLGATPGIVLLSICMAVVGIIAASIFCKKYVAEDNES
ncbi:MFS transporter [Cohnella sp. WQ 127256]|uniref:MFS transporter n=1 Tax=Cohnella sp. WQ 127256 TaxID=2938790 RepID=UPI002118A2D9|nr:MFS transporter [Cohnella sp. WQ 127256]